MPGTFVSLFHNCALTQIIKIYAALHGQTIREYVLESIWEHLNRDNEEKQLLAITTQISPVLKEVWDNKKDDIY